VTNFVGRRHEVAQIKRLLSGARLVTLTGVGGAGKTRLALRVAAESRRLFRDGVWLVDLAPLQDGSLFAYALAETLGLRDQTDRPVAEVIADHVRDRELLIVLDNCEHLLDACAEFAAQALRIAPDLRILCTSRQPLGTVGEHLWAVPPMPVPDPRRPPGPGDPSYAALVLFADRASVVAPGFALRPDNVGIVAEICRRLDGLPLAIELAAAQLRMMSLGQLASALHDRFSVLATRYAVPAHHRTLAATFDWSYELCSPAEQRLWQRMSVFADGFDLPAAEYVCDADADADAGAGADADVAAGAGGRQPAAPILDAITGLVDKSVLGREDLGGQVRYRLLETVRQYGLERLRATDGEEAVLRRRHRDWYRRLAERFAAEWFGADQRLWSARMRAEHPNLRAAMTFSLATSGEQRAALSIAAHTFFFWYGGGLIHEGLYWLDRTLAANPEPTVERLAALAASTWFTTSQGNRGVAEATAMECLETAEQMGEPLYVTRATADLGAIALMGNDLPRARMLLDQAMAAAHGNGGEIGILRTLAQVPLAMTLLHQGDAGRAAAICAESRAACEARGEQWWQAYALYASALIALAQGEAATATGHLEASLRLRYPLGDVLGMAASIERLGWLAAGCGDYVRAAVLMGAAYELWRASGGTLYGAVRWLRGQEECQARTREALGDAAYERAFRRGTTLPLEDAVQCALQATRPAKVKSRDRAAAPLTPRERQVAELVTEGLSNKQIAARLVISQRTAESHVENILRKLGLTSRTRLAAWMSRHDSTRE
jgi:non-specific serine/threonine protein kinase